MPELPPASSGPDDAADIGTTPGVRPAPAEVPARFQFSLAQLIVFTTLVAVFCAVTFTVPTWLSMILAGCFLVALPMVFTVGLVWGRGYQRTFCLGALFPSGVVILHGSQFFLFQTLQGPWFGAGGMSTRVGVWVVLLVLGCVSLASGLLAIGVRRWLESSRRGQSPGAESPTAPPEDPFSSM